MTGQALVTSEQQLLQESVRRFLDDKSPESAVRALMETAEGYDPVVWKGLASDLGVQAILIPEEFGGLGMSYQELCIVFEEMGRCLLCAPFFSTIALATNAILLSGDAAAGAKFLPAIARGESIATLAVVERSGQWDPSAIQTLASRAPEGWRLNGEKMFVLDGLTANLILVAARVDAGIGLFAVTSDSPGLTRQPLEAMDATRKQAQLTFSNTPALRIGPTVDAWTVLESTRDLAAVALAAEQVGGMQKLLETSVEYAKSRVQFGRAIGSFQAIKHMCAEALLDVESAKLAARAAYRAAATEPSELTACASLAKAYCSEAYFRMAVASIQIHGGMGFTWECADHLYFRRAKSSEMMLGTPEAHRERFLQSVGL